jgi:hypothetical protein
MSQSDRITLQHGKLRPRCRPRSLVRGSAALLEAGSGGPVRGQVVLVVATLGGNAAQVYAWYRLDASLTTDARTALGQKASP